MVDIESSEKPAFICPTCQQTYSRAEYLRRHERKHTAARPFICDDCPKTFARSDVLLRHRRRCHPEEAALAEAVKPPPSTGPKKQPRSRNRNAQRPYPPRSKAKSSPQLAADSDLDGSAPEEDAIPNPTENVSYVRGSPSDHEETGSARNFTDHSNASVPSLMPDLSWSPENSFSNDSSSDHTASTSSPSFPESSAYLMQRSPSSSFMPLPAPSQTIHQLSPSTSTNHALPDIPHPATTNTSISLLEAGAAMWAHHVDAPMTKSDTQLNQFGSWYAFPPISDEAPQPGVDPTPNLSTLIDRAPLEPHLDTSDQVNWELLHLARNGDWGVLREKGVDVLDPEYTMINSESKIRIARVGDVVSDLSHPFYIPPGLFAGCYTVPHWLLPPIQRLSFFASCTFKHILGHLGVVHQPTFRLAEVHSWLAFAMCTAAGHRPYKSVHPTIEEEPWDAVQSVVRTEKTGMFVKLFARSGSKIPLPESFAGIQAMLIYNSHAFLSDDPSDRLIGEMFFTTIAKIARRCGLYDLNAPFVKSEFHRHQDPDNSWRRWVQGESWRRTAWLIFILDVLASIEAGSVPLVSPRDVKHLPLPTPMSVWNAASSLEWVDLMSKPAGMSLTLDFVMEKLFDFATIPDDDLNPAPPCLLDVLELGPFARLMVMLTIMRGIIEYGEGKPQGGYVVQRWILKNGAPGSLVYDGTSEDFHRRILAVFLKAVGRWKVGWDYDAQSTMQNVEAHRSPLETDPPITALFVHDALPFWWMSYLLLSQLGAQDQQYQGQAGVCFGGIAHLDEPAREPGEGKNRLAGVDLARMFGAAKNLARTGGQTTG